MGIFDQAVIPDDVIAEIHQLRREKYSAPGINGTTSHCKQKIM